MKRTLIFVGALIAIASCIVDRPQSETELYDQADSTFNINGKIFKVSVSQFDLTGKIKNDTMSRPTYACSLKIFNNENKVVFSDSLLRDSWAYPGRIYPIEAYQIALPQLKYESPEIILSFNIFEEMDGDAIHGLVGFDTRTLQSRYFWEAALDE